MSELYRGRFAPSPTGRIHLGNARTALIAWLDARQAGGRFVMRIEDVDPLRSRPELEARLLADLRWLGIDWDEGPDVGGPFGPYRQSARSELYEGALARLATYRCSCTRRELRATEAVVEGEEPRYPGTCREGARAPARATAIRWRTPAGAVAFADRVMGPISQDVAATVGDLLLRRSDGAWAYQLAVVVDDAAMRITDVVRGADLLSSTPRQLLLLRALDAQAPSYAHVPLILGEDGQKLSKRHGAPDISALREGGAAPERVIAALAGSLGIVGPEVQAITAAELVGALDLRRLRPMKVAWERLSRGG